MMVFQSLIRRQNVVALLVATRASTNASADHAKAQKTEKQHKHECANDGDFARYQTLTEVWQFVAKHIDGDSLVAILNAAQARLEAY